MGQSSSRPRNRDSSSACHATECEGRVYRFKFALFGHCSFGNAGHNFSHNVANKSSMQFSNFGFGAEARIRVDPYV